jgi:hypothetical protein
MGMYKLRIAGGSDEEVGSGYMQAWHDIITSCATVDPPVKRM